MINHVSTLEQGKKLKALGWNKPTKFVWVGEGENAYLREFDEKLIRHGVSFVLALLSDEALGELPSYINKNGVKYWLEINKNADKVWAVRYVAYCEFEATFLHDIVSDELPIAATDMLIWAIENGHVKVGGKV